MKNRPPLYWKSIRIGGPSLVISATILVIGGRLWLGVGLLLGGFALLLVPWLLSPYSGAVQHFAAPTDEDLDRSERFADRLGSLPLFGVLWRFAERLSGNAGRKAVEDYRR